MGWKKFGAHNQQSQPGVPTFPWSPMQNEGRDLLIMPRLKHGSQSREPRYEIRQCWLPRSSLRRVQGTFEPLKCLSVSLCLFRYLCVFVCVCVCVRAWVGQCVCVCVRVCVSVSVSACLCVRESERKTERERERQRERERVSSLTVCVCACGRAHSCGDFHKAARISVG